MVAIALAPLASAKTVDPDGGWTRAGRPETAAIVLDAELADPRAALARFALAERLGDDRALAGVLTPAIVDALPWSTRDRAHLVLGRAALERGEDPRPDLARVYPDSPAWAEARLLLGDAARRDGDLRTAVLDYRDAIGPDADGVALLRIADVYTELGRWDTVANTLEMVPRRDPAWTSTLARTARAQLAVGDVGWALGTLMVSDTAEAWAPERALLRAAAAARPTADARTELAGWSRAIEAFGGRALGATGAWDAWFGGASSSALPAGWSVAFLRRPAPSVLLERLGRIERELALAEVGDPLAVALVERRAATVAALGDALLAALDEERIRLDALATGPDPLVGRPRPPAPSSADVVWWPFNGELWSDELAVVRSP